MPRGASSVLSLQYIRYREVHRPCCHYNTYDTERCIVRVVITLHTIPSGASSVLLLQYIRYREVHRPCCHYNTYDTERCIVRVVKVPFKVLPSSSTHSDEAVSVWLLTWTQIMLRWKVINEGYNIAYPKIRSESCIHKIVYVIYFSFDL